MSLVDDFIDGSLCDQLIELALASPTLSEAQVNWKEDSDLSDGNEAWQRSSSAFLPKAGRQMDPAVAMLNAKVAWLTRILEWALGRGNSLQIARYHPGQHYWPHFDSRHLKDLGEQALLDAGGGGAVWLSSSRQRTLLSSAGFPHATRFATVLLFLKEPDAGGNTHLSVGVSERRGGTEWPRAGADGAQKTKPRTASGGSTRSDASTG